jgi:hypothetical protein
MGPRTEALLRQKQADLQEAAREEARRREEEEDSRGGGAPAAGRRGHSAKVTINFDGVNEILGRTKQALRTLKEQMVENIGKMRTADVEARVVLTEKMADMKIRKARFEKEIEQLSRPLNVDDWDASKEEMDDWIVEWRERGRRALEADKQMAMYIGRRYVLVDEHNAIVAEMARTGRVNMKLGGVIKSIEYMDREIKEFFPKCAQYCETLEHQVVRAPLSIQTAADVVLQHLKSLGEIRQDEDSFFDEESLKGFDQMAQDLYNMLLKHLSDVKVLCDKRFGVEDLMQRIANLKVPKGRAKPSALPEFKRDLQRIVEFTAQDKSADHAQLSRLVGSLKVAAEEIQTGIGQGIAKASQPLNVDLWDASEEEMDAWIVEWRKRGERAFKWHRELKGYVAKRCAVEEEKHKFEAQTAAMAKTREDTLKIQVLTRKSERMAEEIRDLKTSFVTGENIRRKRVVEAPPSIEEPVNQCMELIYTLATIRQNFVMLYRKATLDEFDECEASIYSLLSDHLQNVEMACEKGRKKTKEPRPPTLRNSPFTKWLHVRSSVRDKGLRWTMCEMNVTMENGRPVERTSRQHFLELATGGSLFEQLVAHVPWYEWTSLTSKSYMHEGKERSGERAPELDWTKSYLFTDEDDCREAVNEFGRRMLGRPGMRSCQLYLYRSSQGGRDRRR